MLAEGKCPEFSIPDFLEFEINHTYAHTHTQKKWINVPIKKQITMSESQKKKHFLILCYEYCLITHLVIFFLNIFVIVILISVSENPDN